MKNKQLYMGISVMAQSPGKLLSRLIAKILFVIGLGGLLEA